MAIAVVGVDLSKSVFQLSLADAKHHIVERKRLSRTQFHRFLAQSVPVRLVMEACGTSHYWARTAISYGHDVKKLHAKYVKAYVRRTKTDAADADALILADNDKSLHPIPVKSEELQALQGLHRIREQWNNARTARICEARASLAEFGVTIPIGARAIGRQLTVALDNTPVLLQGTLRELIQEIADLKQRIKNVDTVLEDYATTNADAQALLSIQGVGVIIATAMVARVPDIHVFKQERAFSSWLGITCREYSSGSTRKLGRITKQGDRYLRMMIIHGVRAALMAARRKAAHDKPLTRLEIWAIWTRRDTFNGDHALCFAA